MCKISSEEKIKNYFGFRDRRSQFHGIRFALYIAVLLFLSCHLTLGVDSYSHAARVIELSDRFLDVRHDGVWLVKFYAPWCGHCKKLEPIFNHVAQALHDSPIRVAKVDCTRYTAVAQEYKIHGYPTILLIKGEEVHTYRGDRTSEEIVQYAKRMLGPAVINVNNENLRALFEKEKILFAYAGKQEGELWDSFNQAALAFQAHILFIHVDLNQVPEEFLKEKNLPFVFVRKEMEEYFFEVSEKVSEEFNLTNSLMGWIGRERFPTFMKITRSNFQDLMGAKKYIVLTVLEEDKLGRITEEMQSFKTMIESIILHDKEQYSEAFQFGWIGQPDIANSVAMTTLPIPSLLVVNTSSFHHYIPQDDPEHLNQKVISMFLNDIMSGNAYAYGGRSIFMRMFRMFYEAKTSLYDMWTGNPILTIILFGLPLGFLSLIFYSICCSDIMDSSGEEEDEISEQELHERHEKKE